MGISYMIKIEAPIKRIKKIKGKNSPVFQLQFSLRKCSTLSFFEVHFLNFTNQGTQT